MNNNHEKFQHSDTHEIGDATSAVASAAHELCAETFEVVAYRQQRDVIRARMEMAAQQLGHPILERGVFRTSKQVSTDDLTKILDELSWLSTELKSLSKHKLPRMEVRPYSRLASVLGNSERELRRFLRLLLTMPAVSVLYHICGVRLRKQPDALGHGYANFLATVGGRSDVPYGRINVPINYRTFVFRTAILLQWVVRFLREELTTRDCRQDFIAYCCAQLFKSEAVSICLNLA